MGPRHRPRRQPSAATWLLAIAALLTAAAVRAGLPAAPTFKWQRCPPSYCETGWYASPAVADVDGDGQPEVIWGGYTLLAVDGASGALEWSYPGSGQRLWPSPVVANLDGAPGLEIALANGAGQVVVLDGAGTVRPGFPALPFGGAGELRTLGAVDLDGDGAFDLFTARATGTSVDTWTVIESNGATRAGWPRHASGDPGYARGAYNQNLAAGDVDGDGVPEILASSDVHYLAAFRAGGAELAASALYGTAPGRPKVWSEVGVHYDPAVDLRGYAMCAPGDPLEPRPNFANAAPVVADLDGDGTNEIVVVGDFYDCRSPSYTQLFQLPIVLRADRTRWAAGPYDWTNLPTPDGGAAPLSTDYNVIETAEANPVVADLDGDGEKEILFASYDGRVHAFWLERTEKYGWPVDLNAAPGPIRFASEPVVADLDHDGKAEVLFTTWTEKGSRAYGELRIVDWQGDPLSSTPLPTPTSADWNGALGAPTLANLDRDADLEVAVGTAHTGLVAYDLPGTAGARVLWATSRGSTTRTAPEPAAAPLVAGLALALLHRRPRARRAS